MAFSIANAGAVLSGGISGMNRRRRHDQEDEDRAYRRDVRQYEQETREPVSDVLRRREIGLESAELGLSEAEKNALSKLSPEERKEAERLALEKKRLDAEEAKRVDASALTVEQRKHKNELGIETAEQRLRNAKIAGSAASIRNKTERLRNKVAQFEAELKTNDKERRIELDRLVREGKSEEAQRALSAGRLEDMGIFAATYFEADGKQAARMYNGTAWGKADNGEAADIVREVDPQTGKAMLVMVDAQGQPLQGPDGPVTIPEDKAKILHDQHSYNSKKGKKSKDPAKIQEITRLMDILNWTAEQAADRVYSKNPRSPEERIDIIFGHLSKMKKYSKQYDAMQLREIAETIVHGPQGAPGSRPPGAGPPRNVGDGASIATVNPQVASQGAPAPQSAPAPAAQVPQQAAQAPAGVGGASDGERVQLTEQAINQRMPAAQYPVGKKWTDATGMLYEVIVDPQSGQKMWASLLTIRNSENPPSIGIGAR